MNTDGIKVGYQSLKKRIIALSIISVFLLLTIPFNQIVPVVNIVRAEDNDGDGLEDIIENMSYYKYFETEQVMYFNSPGSQQGADWEIYDHWMNIIRPKYRFSVNVTQRDGNGVLYINVGNETTTQMNESLSINSLGTLMTEKIPADPDDLEVGYLRVRLTSDSNFTIDNFKMESTSAWNDSDTDDDGLTDGQEDSNYDGMTQNDETHPLIADSDDDGLIDGDEGTHNCDPLDSDTDNDNLIDGDEVHIHYTEPDDDDSDDDLLDDGEEVNTYNTNPNVADTDGDGLNDYQEIVTYSTNPLNNDTDSDNLTDGAEVNTYSTNPLDSDTDNDGLSDGDEVLKYFTNPLSASNDTDGDGLYDQYEILELGTDHEDTDSDDDGLWDGFDGGGHYGELSYHNVTYHGTTFTISPTDPMDDDSDDDALTDYFEIITGWEVTVDGNSYQITSNPNRRISNPNDGTVDLPTGRFYDDKFDYDHHTDPWLKDTDNDGYEDSEEEVVFRTNAENGDYDESGVWISLNSHNIGSHILDTYDYDSTTQVFFGNNVESKIRSNDGFGIYRYYDQQSGDRFLYIFYDKDNRTFATENAWKFTYSDDNDLSTTSKRYGPYSYKFLKDPEAGYSEVWLNNTISDMDNDGLLDYSERETDPLVNDTDSDGLSDYIETNQRKWEYWDNFTEKNDEVLWNDEYLSPLVDDADGDGLLDGEEIGVMYRSNSFDGTYDSSTWITINNGTILYSSSLWMTQFSGFSVYNTSIKQSISENYSLMTAYGHVGQFTDFAGTSELGLFLCNNSFGHAVYAYNFSTIFVDPNATDGVVEKFNLTGNSISSADVNPFPVATYGITEVINISLWTNPFCDDSDGDAISDFDEIKTYGSYALDSDPDADGLNDYYEIHYNSTDQGYSPFTGVSNETDLNPFSPDTDSDGLWDGNRIMNGNITVHLGENSYVESYSDSDPLKNDTDGDGLFDGYQDGGEKVIMTYHSDKIIPINESIPESYAYLNDTNARDGSNGGYGYLGYMNITLNAFLSYNRSDQLNITIGCKWDNGSGEIHDSWFLTDQVGPGNKTRYISCTIFDKINNINDWDTVLSVGSSNWLWKPIALGNWYIKVSDGSQDGSEPGTIQWFEMYVEYRTDPTDSDSDDDGLNDSEESTFGNYGYITNPWDWDTDLDLLSDYDEVYGTGDAISTSNPIQWDTDGDGTDDGQDLHPLGNAYFTFEFWQIKVLSSCNESDGSGDDEFELYPVVAYYDEGISYESREIFSVPETSQGYWLTKLEASEVGYCPSGDQDSWTIIVDGPAYYSVDTALKLFYLRLYEQDGGNADDVMLLNASDDNAGIYTAYYNISTGGTQQFTTSIQTAQEQGATDSNVQMIFNVTHGYIAKKNTLLVLPMNDTMSMNATIDPNNSTDDQLRFTVPEMSFTLLLVYVNDTTGIEPFNVGINTILVPDPIFFASQFWNLTNSTNSTTVENILPAYMLHANWTMYNESEVTRQITFVIYFNCSADNATELLDYLLTNATGNKTCWYENITNTIFQNGLPNHLTSFVPSGYVKHTLWDGPGIDQDEDDDTPWQYIGSTVEAVCVIVDDTITDGLSTIDEWTGLPISDYVGFVFDLAMSGGKLLFALGQWGFGALKDPKGAIDDIIEVVNDVINAIVNRIRVVINNIFKVIVNPLIEYIEAARDSIKNAFFGLSTFASWFDNSTFLSASQMEKRDHYNSFIAQGTNIFNSVFNLEVVTKPLIEGLEWAMKFIEPYQKLFSVLEMFKLVFSLIGVSNMDFLSDFVSSGMYTMVDIIDVLINSLIVDGPITDYFSLNIESITFSSESQSPCTSSSVINIITMVEAAENNPLLDIVMKIIKYIIQETDLFKNLSKEIANYIFLGVIIAFVVFIVLTFFTLDNKKIIKYGMQIFSAISNIVGLIADENEENLGLVVASTMAGLLGGCLGIIVAGYGDPGTIARDVAIGFSEIVSNAISMIYKSSKILN